MNKITVADLENLWSEVKLHQTLNHKNIIQFYDCIQTKNHLYFLLEYANNGCLFYYIHANDGIPEQLAIRFLYQTSLAVKFLHDKKFIHRDIKPENIVFDKNFDIKLCDFGWSCFLQDNQYRTSVCGTFEYMSPEIVRDRYHTNKVDIWCLGILLYEMLHGNPPFKGQSLTELNKEFMYNPIMINSDISSHTKNLLQNLLQQNPKKRYNINQLLKHEVFQHFKDDLNRPLNKQEIKLLIKIFISNSGGAQKKNLPDAVKKYLQKKKKIKQKLQQQKQQTQNIREENFQKQKDDYQSKFVHKEDPKNDTPNLYSNIIKNKIQEQKNYFIQDSINKNYNGFQYYQNFSSNRNISLPKQQSYVAVNSSRNISIPQKQNSFNLNTDNKNQYITKYYQQNKNQPIIQSSSLNLEKNNHQHENHDVKNQTNEKQNTIESKQNNQTDNQEMKKYYSSNSLQQQNSFYNQSVKNEQKNYTFYKNADSTDFRQAKEDILQQKNNNKKLDNSIMKLNLDNIQKQDNKINIKNFSSQRNIIPANPFKQQNTSKDTKEQIKKKLKNPLQFRMINSERRISQPIQSSLQKQDYQQLSRKQSNVSLSEYKYKLKDGILTKIKITDEDREFHRKNVLSNSQSQILQNTTDQSQNKDAKLNYLQYQNNQNKEGDQKVLRKRVVSQRTISLDQYNLTNNTLKNSSQKNDDFKNLYQSINFNNENKKLQNGYSSFYSILNVTPVSNLIYFSNSSRSSSKILKLLICFLENLELILKQDMNLFLLLFLLKVNQNLEN